MQMTSLDQHRSKLSNAAATAMIMFCMLAVLVAMYTCHALLMQVYMQCIICMRAQTMGKGELGTIGGLRRADPCLAAMQCC